MTIKNKFETTETGRGSKTHKEYLKKKIKETLGKQTKLQILQKLKTMSLEELNDRAEFLLKQIEEDESADVLDELKVLGDILRNISK